MTGPDRLPATIVAQAMLDRDGQLISADPALDVVNARAGGMIGEPLAPPALAAVVRLAGRLGIVVSRSVVVADEDGDLLLWVSARPHGDGIRLAASGWEPMASVAAPADPPRPEALDADVLRWECDAALRLTRLTGGATAALTINVADLIGRPIGALFAGFDPARGAVAKAMLLPTDAAVHVTSHPVRGRDGRAVGYQGSASIAEIAAPVMLAPSLPPAFTAGLDRALRRPLAQIVANADSIAQATDGPIAPDYADYAADIAGAGRHLLALVDDLVDLEAVERPGFSLRPEAIDLADVARRAAGLLGVRAEAAGVSISRPVPEAALPAIGDFRRALQIVVNLVTNAVRYAPPGSAVVVAVAERDGRALLSVADRGKGIAPSDQARVFGKFERVDASEPGGNGLGLYIARRLARAMNGDLVLESAAGEGARFTLSLPAR